MPMLHSIDVIPKSAAVLFSSIVCSVFHVLVTFPHAKISSIQVVNGKKSGSATSSIKITLSERINAGSRSSGNREPIY
jgi:hypothetical protein